MKAKNQQNYTSELDAKEKLVVYVYEYLVHSNARQAADIFKDIIGYRKEIKVNEGPGFLFDWWSVFWDLYCAAPERRDALPESSSDARAFYDLMRSTQMSPSITQTSPPQHLQQPPPPQFMGGSRYGQPPPPPPPQGQRGMMQSRLQAGPPPQHGGPHPGGPPAIFNPRYQHSGPLPPQQSLIVPGPIYGPGPDQMVPSPGLNRMTPLGGPPPPPQQQQQVVGPPPPMVGMPGQQMGPGPPRNGSQGSAGGWQPNVSYNVNSPANQSCYNGPGSNQPSQVGPMMMGDGSMIEVKSSPLNGGEPSTPHPEEYVMPVSFNQDGGDQCDSAEILKMKQSLQEDSTKMFDKDQYSEY